MRGTTGRTADNISKIFTISPKTSKPALCLLETYSSPVIDKDFGSSAEQAIED